MIPRAQLVAERASIIRLGCVLPPLSSFSTTEEQVEQRLIRMWSAGRSIALISACVGLEPHEIRDRCRGVPRASIRSLQSGCSRPLRHVFDGSPSVAFSTTSTAGASVP